MMYKSSDLNAAVTMKNGPCPNWNSKNIHTKPRDA